MKITIASWCNMGVFHLHFFQFIATDYSMFPREFSRPFHDIEVP